ncbi:MAG: pyrroline-5-carboxylate reductase dimerization domain-containing protein, partial [Candidatus Omnitrophota bacterium]
MREIKSCRHLGDKLFISIAAGILTTYIEKHLGIVRVIRAMPNIALSIQEAMTCLCSGKYASIEDFDFAEDLFDYMGETMRIQENRFDWATAVSGSGPGYFFNLIQAKKIDSNNVVLVKKFSEEFFKPELTEAAKNIGFNQEEAEFLSKATSNSCIGLLIKTALPPEELEKQVVSKGGTTFAGLEVLRKGGTLIQAVEAAKKRSEELSKKKE